MLHALKVVLTTMMAAARDTDTPPPRTAVKGEYGPAPLAEQFQNMLDGKITEALLAIGTSTDTPPPLLLDAGEPTAPIATVTKQLLNDDECIVIFEYATLLAYTAPPPPLAIPDGTDVELVTAEHAAKLQLIMNNVKLDPANFSAGVGRNEVKRKTETWGECSTDSAPPYTEVELDATPPVKETAEQSVKELSVNATLESMTVVTPNAVGTNLSSKFMLYTKAPTTMATAPPIACSRITSKQTRDCTTYVGTRRGTCIQIK